MLERSILRYCSEPSVPSHKLPISALVPEMICKRLFNSLVAFETDSFETDLRDVRVDWPSEFTAGFKAFGMPVYRNYNNICANMSLRDQPPFSEIPFAIGSNHLIF